MLADSTAALQGRGRSPARDPPRGWAGEPVGAHSPAESAGPSPDRADRKPGGHLCPCPASSAQAHAARVDPDPRASLVARLQRPLPYAAPWMTALSNCGNVWHGGGGDEEWGRGRPIAGRLSSAANSRRTWFESRSSFSGVVKALDVFVNYRCCLQKTVHNIPEFGVLAFRTFLPIPNQGAGVPL